MATKFSTLRETMSPERRERIARRTSELMAALPLQELRKARDLSQEELAASLGVNQATISKLERRTDMYLSTMRRFVDAMGGELEITARFPEGSVTIEQFSTIASKEKVPVAHKKTTGTKAASKASTTLRGKATAKASKSAAGSALSQTSAPRKTTSTKAASAASKTLRDGRTSKASKAAAGSALSQKHGKKGKK
jgi:transcriptional regulator with XRE-family HTH domain